jgi:hypothetical protein
MMKKENESISPDNQGWIVQKSIFTILQLSQLDFWTTGPIHCSIHELLIFEAQGEIDENAPYSQIRMKLD